MLKQSLKFANSSLYYIRQFLVALNPQLIRFSSAAIWIRAVKMGEQKMSNTEKCDLPVNLLAFW